MKRFIHLYKDIQEFQAESIGNQPTWIPRALYWISKETRGICRGKWVRQLCWITFQDLRWALGEKKKDKLFFHKDPFKFNEELIECILVARQGRK